MAQRGRTEELEIGRTPVPHPSELPRDESRLAAWLLLPAMVVILLLFVLPVAYELWVSVHRSRVYEDASPFVGAKNYTWLFRSGDLPQSILNTLVWTIGSVVGQAVFGILLAVILVQQLPGRNLFRTLFLIAWVMPGVVVGIIWRWMYNPIGGILNDALAHVGLPEVDFLGHASTALASCVVANVWKGIPFWLLMVSARLQAIPEDLYEAASIDGTTPWQRFLHVTFPQIRGVVMLCAVLSFIWTFNVFDLIYALTRGGPDIATTTVPILIYEIGIRNGHMGEASAASLILLAIMALSMLVLARFTLARQEDV